MDPCRYAVLYEMTPELIAPLGPDDVQVVYMADIVLRGRYNHVRVVKEPIVQLGLLAPCVVPLGQVLELHPEDGALDLIHPAVETFHLMIVLLRPAVVSQHANPAGDFRVVGHNGTAVAVSAQVLAGIEAEAGHLSEVARSPAFVFSAVGLGGVFDHPEPVLLRDLVDGVHVGRLSEEMHGNHSFGLRCDLPFEVGYVDVIGVRINVGEYNLPTCRGHGLRRGDKRIGGDHDLVAVADVTGP